MNPEHGFKTADRLACTPVPLLPYSIYGFRLNSEIPLPELVAPSQCDAPGDVVIRLGPVAGTLDSATCEGAAFQANEREYLLDARGVARYQVLEGREIVVDRYEGASESDIRAYLLGSVLGALCHQRGIISLHASAIEVDGRAVAFAGKSGAGKSTLAGYFQGVGYRVLCDDVCAINFDGAGCASVWPGIRRIKLWRDALDALGRTPGPSDTPIRGLQKFQCSLDMGVPEKALRLDRIYFLQKTRASKSPKIESLRGLAASEAVLAETYRRHMVVAMGRQAQHLRQSVRLLQTVKAFEASRHWGHAVFADEAARLETHFRCALTSQ